MQEDPCSIFLSEKKHLSNFPFKDCPDLKHFYFQHNRQRTIQLRYLDVPTQHAKKDRTECKVNRANPLGSANVDLIIVFDTCSLIEKVKKTDDSFYKILMQSQSCLKAMKRFKESADLGIYARRFRIRTRNKKVRSAAKKRLFRRVRRQYCKCRLIQEVAWVIQNMKLFN